MFIDIHVHTTAMPSIPWRGRDETLATPEQLIEMYDSVGIAQGVLLPNANPEGIHCIQSNEEILAIVEQYPHRFIPFCNIDPRLWVNNPEEDLSYYIGWYKDHGCRGIGEVCCNLSYDDPRVENLFHHAEKCQMPLCFHIATRDGNTYGLIDEPGLPRFEKAIQKFPDLIWLCHSQPWWSHISGDVNEDNWGSYPKGPVTEGGRVVELMHKYPNVIGDLSAGSGYNAVSRDPQFGYWFFEEFQNQLCFGTDVCAPSNRDNVLINLANFLKDALAKGNITQEVFDKIAFGNAQHVLRL